MSDIFNEIDQDIRQERLGRLWRRLGPAVIAVAVLIIVGVGGWRYWEHSKAEQAAAAGARYEAALALARDGKHAEADEALKAIAADAPEGYRALALFRAASEQAAVDPAKGIGAFEAITQDGSITPVLRDMARIRAGYLLIDTGSPADVASRVEVLAAPGNSWRHAAREILALSHWKAGDMAEARRWAEELVADVEAPAGSRARAQILLDLASGASQPGAAVPEEAPVAEAAPADAAQPGAPDSAAPQVAVPATSPVPEAGGALDAPSDGTTMPELPGSAGPDAAAPDAPAITEPPAADGAPAPQN
ncbi:tetratricopeptide repeat protein [Terrihabitans rhizophilus]|uniref:Tetratricopeptide repeat protein n=1 Tax=Terrihabitans rhizophilus TaxID=3092662 RepID=A0ABU4RK80_9HYPH|nr:tetratricopeptide repeat protein [Terrihabitans sp. PJ23]MDX6805235.1 tetratricopeptide repeat protein [Terrihabitans sp. PJ23]